MSRTINIIQGHLMPVVSACNNQSTASLRSIIEASHHEIESFARAVMYKSFHLPLHTTLANEFQVFNIFSLIEIKTSPDGCIIKLVNKMIWQ